jgi:A/G-specific adenine glycosylase
VLVSEVMLQQTQASRVEPVFLSFLERFPTVQALADASRADVLRAWSGMGYNGRAVRLQRAAASIVHNHGGRVPEDPDGLRTLPGVGPYTASAVASIAYGRPVAAVDTNARRVLARVSHAAERDEVSPTTVAEIAEAWLDRDDPGAWNQALMDLGRDACRPAPRCAECPLAPWCAFRRAGRLGRHLGGRQGRFEGSLRQVRGAVVDALRRSASRSSAQLAKDTGFSEERVREAVEGLAREGLVEAAPRGRFRLPS